MIRRGYGVAAGLDAEVATPLAARCDELGYTSMWSNDHPGALGLETLAAFAEGSDRLDLGVAVMALDRHDPIEINGHIERLGLDRERLWLGLGTGFDKKPLTTVKRVLPELRDVIPGVRLVLAAMGPKMCEFAGANFDGVFFNWMSSEFAAGAREHVERGAEIGRPRAASGLRLRPYRRRRGREPSASPRRSRSTATSTTATATTSTASALPRARSASPPRTPRRARPRSPSTTSRSTSSSCAGSPAPRSSRWAPWPKRRRRRALEAPRLALALALLALLLPAVAPGSREVSVRVTTGRP